MEKNNKGFIKELQDAGAKEITIKFDTSTEGENIIDLDDSISSTDLENQEQLNIDKKNRYPWAVNFLEALKYNTNLEDDCCDSKQHIDDESAEELTSILEKKIIKKSKCEPIYEALTHLTNYLYDTYDYNYTTDSPKMDAQGNYVFNIVKNIIDEINEAYLKINLKEAEQIIEAISEKFGDKYKVDNSIFLNIISKVACTPNGKDIMEVTIKFMNKFECINTPASLKELVDKIEVIVKKYGDTSVLKGLVLAIEENDIKKDILIKKIIGSILTLKKDEYERLKNQKVNDGNIFEISAEDLQTLITNYKTKNFANKKVDDIISKHKKRRIKNSPKNIGEKKIFTRNPKIMIGTAGVLVAALLSVVVITKDINNNAKTSNNATELAETTEFETDDEELEEDILEELPEVLQESNQKYIIAEYKDPISEKKTLGYIQLDRNEYDIPATGNVFITKDKVIEDVDRYEITPLVTEMYLNEDSGAIAVKDDLKIENGSYIYVLLYNPQDAKEGEYFTYVYYDEDNVYKSTISSKNLEKMVDNGIVFEYEDGENKMNLSTYIPTFFTINDEVIDSKGNVIQSEEPLLGYKEITENGEKIHTLSIIPREQNNEPSELLVSEINGEENLKKIDSSIDKYIIDQSEEPTGLERVGTGTYNLDEDIYVYSSENTTGIPEYLLAKGVKITLYEYDFGYIVAEENGHTGAISIEDGDRIKENIELELELQSSTENEDEESTYDEDEYLEESEENTEDTEISSFDAFDEEIEYE